MARATGGDVILTLMTQVAEVREEVRQSRDEAFQAMAVMKRSWDQMERNVARLASIIGTLVDTMKSRFDDHEERISALERKVGDS